MATASKPKAAAKQARASTAPDPRVAGAPPADASTKAADEEPPPRRTKKEEAGDQTVSVVAPQAFNLTDDDGTVLRYEAGFLDMPRRHAEHWYAKAHGVEIKD